MVSHKHKFVFIHSPKCGGGSIKKILRKHLAGSVIEAPNSNHWELWRHYELHGKDLLDSYFKFGVIRNPWDRMVSWFHHCKSRHGFNGSFEDFIIGEKFLNHNSFSRNKFLVEGENKMDFIIKLENIEEDFEIVTKKFGIKNYNMTRERHGSNRIGNSYEEYYNEETKNKVEETFSWDINNFGYSFGDK